MILQLVLMCVKVTTASRVKHIYIIGRLYLCWQLILGLRGDQMIFVQSLYVIQIGCTLCYMTAVFAEASRRSFNPVITSYGLTLSAVIPSVVSDTVTQTLSDMKVTST